MPDRRQLLFVEHLNICLVATIQNESDHVNPAKPSSIMKGSTGPWGFLKLATGTWGASVFEKPGENIIVAVASSEMKR